MRAVPGEVSGDPVLAAAAAQVITGDSRLQTADRQVRAEALTEQGQGESLRKSQGL